MKRAFAWLLGMMICASVARGGDIQITAVMATGKYEKPTSVFTPDAPGLFVLLKIKGMKKGDKLRAVWFADEVGDAVPAHSQIAETTLTTDKADPTEGDFSITRPPEGWPAGNTTWTFTRTTRWPRRRSHCRRRP